ncbi:alkaline phosphatase family protein [Stomatohabitans albus]|uniref:alkaline phosphatase family protein n=1 Tax=Stomatohabitans albus TaxID=3110766 RepID=UPI00300D0AD0
MESDHSSQTSTPSSRSNLVLIGIDGLNWGAADDQTAPTLRALAEQGAFATMTMPVPTLSGPGWATLLTGASPAQHGVVDNTFRGNNLALCPDLLSRAFHQDPTTITFAGASWPPLVDPNGVGPVIHHRAEQSSFGTHRVVSRDGEILGYQRCDAEIATYARAALRLPICPNVGFVHFCDADETAHLHGSTGPEYRASIAQIDTYVADIVIGVQERVSQFKERWLVAVTTDHGHRPEGGHGGGTPQEVASFVIIAGFGTDTPAMPPVLEPTALMPFLLAAR